MSVGNSNNKYRIPIKRAESGKPRMEPWCDKEMIELGEFVNRHGIAVGIELELRKLTQRFAKISADFDELNEEEKAKKREEFFETQNIFFGTGAKIAN